MEEYPKATAISSLTFIIMAMFGTCRMYGYDAVVPPLKGVYSSLAALGKVCGELLQLGDGVTIGTEVASLYLCFFFFFFFFFFRGLTRGFGAKDLVGGHI